MWNQLNRTADPSDLPLSIADLRMWLKLDLNDEDPLIYQLIQDAVDYVEGPHGIGIALMEQTWEQYLDCFPCVIRIPLGPVQSVESIKYIDAQGDEQTLDESEYQVDTVSQPARVMPAFDKAWPNARHEMNAVTVEFKAGYDKVPGDLKRAMALLVGHWEENRSATTSERLEQIPFAVENIMNKYRAGRVA